MKIVAFSIENSDGSAEEKLEAVFDKEEIDILEAYLQQTEELRRTRLIQRGLTPSLNIKWTKEEGFSVETQLPPEDDLLALLHRIRPFILKQEYASFEKTTSLLRKKFKSQRFQHFLKYFRHMYQGKQIESIMSMSVNGLNMNSEKLMVDWLNSYEYHRDQDKKKKLKPVFEILSHDGAKALFFMFVVDKVKAILSLSSLINLMLEKGDVKSLHFDPNPNKGTP